MPLLMRRGGRLRSLGLPVCLPSPRDPGNEQPHVKRPLHTAEPPGLEVRRALAGCLPGLLGGFGGDDQVIRRAAKEKTTYLGFHPTHTTHPTNYPPGHLFADVRMRGGYDLHPPPLTPPLTSCTCCTAMALHLAYRRGVGWGWVGQRVCQTGRQHHGSRWCVVVQLGCRFGEP